MPITEAQLKAATKILPPDSFPIWVSILNAAMARWEIDRPNRIIDFMAHALHESAEFTKLGEGLNYSPEGLANTWRNRFAARLPSGDYAVDQKGRYLPNEIALRLGRTPQHPADQQGIANLAYGGRMGNGPPESGDGWKNRGRGIFMNTGAENYQKCGVALGLDLVNHPELLEVRANAAMAAGWHWSKTNCNALSDGGDPDFKLTTKAVNGGLIGLAKRVEYRHKLRGIIL